MYFLLNHRKTTFIVCLMPTTVGKQSTFAQWMGELMRKWMCISSEVWEKPPKCSGARVERWSWSHWILNNGSCQYSRRAMGEFGSVHLPTTGEVGFWLGPWVVGQSWCIPGEAALYGTKEPKATSFLVSRPARQPLPSPSGQDNLRWGFKELGAGISEKQPPSNESLEKETWNHQKTLTGHWVVLIQKRTCFSLKNRFPKIYWGNR